MVSYTFNASFVYVGKGSNALKTHIIIETFATHENTEYHHQISISGFYSVLDEIYRNKLYYFISINVDDHISICISLYTYPTEGVYVRSNFSDNFR